MYKILGADGRQYGPVSGEQLARWIAEGRANAHTQTLAEGAAEWKPLGSLPEFAAHLTAAPPAISPLAMRQRTTNQFAVWGLICGILAVVFCFCCCLSIPLGALGLIFSIIGISQISEFPDVYDGRAVAIVGIILSALGLFGGILFLAPDVLNGGFHHYHRYWNFLRP